MGENGAGPGAGGGGVRHRGGVSVGQGGIIGVAFVESMAIVND